MRWFLVFIGFVVVTAVSACSNPGRDNPVDPPAGPFVIQPVQVGAQSNRHLWGLWEISFSSDHLSAEALPVRQAGMHLNLVRALEVAPCTNCLSVSNITATSPNELRADLTLVHPLPGNLEFSGFDVRGVFISGSDCHFPSLDRRIAWGATVPRLVNHDGFTQLFNPTEFDPSGPGSPLFKYMPGRFSRGDGLSATVNPYIAYSEDQPRRIFLPGEVKTRTVILEVPEGKFDFGYAVDACWQKVFGPVTDPITDFPEGANCVEAYRIDVETGSGLTSEPASSVSCTIVVYDHQGENTIDDVVIEAPDLFNGNKFPIFHGYIGDDGYLFSCTLGNELGAGDGEYPLLVQGIDKNMDQNLGSIDAWQVCTVRVGPKEGWVRTWGGGDRDACWDMAIDDGANVYVCGEFVGDVDFDPGAGYDPHTADGTRGAFLCKFDSAGEFLWARTWGGASASAVCVDGSGNPFVAGVFYGVVDLDPGDGVDEHEAKGLDPDVFLSRFDATGELQWARSWGAPYLAESVQSLAAGDMGTVHVTGYFNGTVDFDPGVTTEVRVSNGEEDAYLSKFDYYGNLEWARTWGGPGGVSANEDDEGWGVAVDGSGGVYVVGNFHTPVDFDPGPAVVERIPTGWEDAFLSRFNSTGDFSWVQTWGGTSSVSATAVALGGLQTVYVLGGFRDTADFDPGPGIDERVTNGTVDCYLSRFGTDGQYNRVLAWGGPWNANATDMAVDGSGNVLATGFFTGTVDLDPGPGVDAHESNGWMDVFLIRLDPLGEFRWGRSWGGAGSMSVFIDDEGTGVTVDHAGNAYITGHFENTADFEPGPGTEEVHANGLWDAFLTKYRPDGTW